MRTGFVHARVSCTRLGRTVTGTGPFAIFASLIPHVRYMGLVRTHAHNSNNKCAGFGLCESACALRVRVCGRAVAHERSPWASEACAMSPTNGKSMTSWETYQKLMKNCIYYIHWTQHCSIKTDFVKFLNHKE